LRSRVRGASRTTAENTSETPIGHTPLQAGRAIDWIAPIHAAALVLLPVILSGQPDTFVRSPIMTPVSRSQPVYPGIAGHEKSPGDKIVAIGTAKKAIENTCERASLPRFTHHCMRH
jgi:hypothetical protein